MVRYYGIRIYRSAMMPRVMLPVWLLLMLLLLPACGAAPQNVLAESDMTDPGEAPLETGVAATAVSPPPEMAPPAPPVVEERDAVEVATPVPEATATPLPSPTATVVPSPTAVPVPVLRQLLTGGCCVNPFWSSDSKQVRFIDKPTADAPAGIYEVAADNPAPVSAGTLYTTTLGSLAANGRFYVRPDDPVTILEELFTGQLYSIPNEGNQLFFSPSAERVAWQVREGGGQGPSRTRQTTLWVADVDGSDARVIGQLRGASISGWVGEETLLLQLPDDSNEDKRLLVRYNLDDRTPVVLDRAARFSGTTISRGGTFVAYYISLDGANPEQNGVWLMDTATGEKQPLPTGAYQWRDATRLVLIPMEVGVSSFRFREYDTETAVLRDLTDPDVLQVRVANNDWSISPDGDTVVFVSANDGNLWALQLGD